MIFHTVSLNRKFVNISTARTELASTFSVTPLLWHLVNRSENQDTIDLNEEEEEINKLIKHLKTS